jgi:hypothetical protein
MKLTLLFIENQYETLHSQLIKRTAELDSMKRQFDETINKVCLSAISKGCACV